jgi:hypothetical protein
MEQVLHELKIIETDDGYRIEIKGDKAKIKQFIERMPMPPAAPGASSAAGAIMGTARSAGALAARKTNRRLLRASEGRNRARSPDGALLGGREPG